MAGTPWNVIPVAEHVRRGTYRADRHNKRDEAPSVPLSATERRRALVGLGPEARRLAAGLLDAFEDWHPAALTTLRLWAQSAERLTAMTDDAERRRETRTYLSLLTALDLGAK